MSGMRTVGLTGGIGSGKSTVARMLAELGASVMDADAAAREVTRAGGAAMDAIRTSFGAAFIGTDGSLDRERMRELVFAQPQAKQQLEAIIHPLVAQRTREHLDQAKHQGSKCVVFDVPLLVESGVWRQRVHKVLVVDCSASLQIQRVTQRSGLQPCAVEKIIASQATRLQRLAAADLVICNQRLDLNELRQEVLAIAPQFGL